MIGDARIVSLGEATHGTREFFQMKHRILEFLVKEMGFTTFGIEATWPESVLINDYVHTGQGDPAALLAGLYFWTWNTEEVLEMIQWMRRHNENPGDAPKVSFFGFDMQFPKMAMENVVGYLTEIDPEAAQRARVSYDCFQPFVSQPLSYGTAGEAVRLECRAGMQTVYDELAARRDELSARSTPERFAWALQSARVALQGEWSLAARNERSGQEGSARRDQAMAENVGWLLDQAGPDAKIVLWAHNGHVRNEPGWMGSHLRERYGEQMVIVGFDFYAGEFTAVAWKNGQPAGGLRTHRVDAPPSGSYEAYFHSAGMPRMVLDLRGIDGGNSATSWLAGPRMMRSIGAAYDDATPANYLYPARLPKEYDVIVYFENTTPSRLLPMRR